MDHQAERALLLSRDYHVEEQMDPKRRRRRKGMDDYQTRVLADGRDRWRCLAYQRTQASAATACEPPTRDQQHPHDEKQRR
ncbi:hypothetical protein [Mumia zhuanghuii]|uniref:Uncharacterized protein n=1 Tax=Mumia zhuanghuii TaxID=2585211 RepID=A0A5C4MDX9_9ACTN|nr:hypothetical protein [Mumia zhuanghuii]TNC31276.1 hypothetical protein FHE65_31885 [Mumia zhuanghuii]